MDDLRSRRSQKSSFLFQVPGPSLQEVRREGDAALPNQSSRSPRFFLPEAQTVLWCPSLAHAASNFCRVGERVQEVHAGGISRFHRASGIQGILFRGVGVGHIPWCLWSLSSLVGIGTVRDEMGTSCQKSPPRRPSGAGTSVATARATASMTEINIHESQGMLIV